MVSFLTLFLAICALHRSFADDELLLVQIVIRHADRAGLKLFATNSSAQVFFRGLGELSDEGLLKAYEQGAAFKERYVDTRFIDPRMIPDETRFESSPAIRVQMSASAFAAGFFPPTSKGTPRLPIIWAGAKESERLIPNSFCNDLFDEALRKYSNTFRNSSHPSNSSQPRLNKTEEKSDEEKLRNSLPKHHLLMALMQKGHLPPKCVGMTAMAIEAAVAESENYRVRLSEQQTDCVNSGGRNFLFRYISALSGAGEDFNLERLRRNVGLLTAELVDNMKKYVACGDNNCAAGSPKLRVYYTHDVSIAALAQIFGGYEEFNKHVAFNAALVFELRKSDNVPYLKIFVKNGAGAPFVQSSRCGDDLCTLDKLEMLKDTYATQEAFPLCDINDLNIAAHHFSLFALVIFLILRSH